MNNTESLLKLFRIQSKKIGNNKCYEETTELEKWQSEISPKYWWQLITFVKFRLNFSSKSITTAANVHLTESLLDSWLKNNNITVDIIYYLCSHFVPFLTNFSFQIYFSTAENRKTEFCGNVLKLDLSELANQMGALVVHWDLWLTGWTPQPRYIGLLLVDIQCIQIICVLKHVENCL